MSRKTTFWSFIFSVIGIAYFYLKSNGSVSNPKLDSTLFVVSAGGMTLLCILTVLCYLISLYVIRYIEVTADEIRVPKSIFSSQVRTYRFEDILAVHIGKIGWAPVATLFFGDKKEMVLGSLFQSKRDFDQFVELLLERIQS
ncbi:hypothetical protein [Vibrio rhizosphaerae]|uniref:PH domain-containing protein n=1 Tax=Vibrio rhizosphaerae TaxID=398736 RepID=A0ABU4IP44_9VIBR|nr:hypothetical protein [Vibrio rhizosphaerae]MDW6091179.1 hypothetical protein [Vibrio rhizosphaerae]